VLANLVRKVFCPPAKKHSKKGSAPESKDSTSTKRFPYLPTPGVTREKDGVIILSNEDPNEARLNSLLKGFQGEGMAGDTAASDDVNVDVTLRAPLGQAPLIMLLFTVGQTALAASSTGKSGLKSISISFEVGLNGRISVVETAGLLDEVNTEGDAGGTEGQDNEALLRGKMSRVLETSQDIGILIEWVLRWRRQHQ
jgi:hypothetical protein